MVCHKCCEIVVKLQKYRVNAVTNDRQLQESSNQPYIPPITDQAELQRLSLQILSEGKKTSNSKLETSKEKNEVINSTLDIQSHESKSSTNRSLSSKLQLASHVSIRNLQKQYSKIILPKTIWQSDLSPVVTLDKSEVEDWQKEEFKRCQEKLSSVQISIRKIVDKPDSTVNQATVKKSDIVSPSIHALTAPPLVSIPTPEFPKNINNKAATISYRPGPKSKKNRLIIKPSQIQENDCVRNNNNKSGLNLVISDVDSAPVVDAQPIKITNPNIGNHNLNSQTSKRLLPIATDTHDVPVKKICTPVDPKKIQKPRTISNHIDAMQAHIPISSNPETINFYEKFPKKFSCEKCKLKFSFKQSLELHKSEKCFAEIDNDEPVPETAKVISNQTVAKQKPDLASSTSNNTTKPLEVTQKAPERADVVFISDSEEEDVSCKINKNLFSKKNLTEDEAIKMLFKKYYHSTLKDNQTQTFVPRRRNVQYLNSNLVCLSNMYKELFTYRVPVHFEIKSIINARFKYADSVSPPKTINNWSNIPTVTIKTLNSCLQDSQPTTVTIPLSDSSKLLKSVLSNKRIEDQANVTIKVPNNIFTNKTTTRRISVDCSTSTFNKAPCMPLLDHASLSNETNAHVITPNTSPSLITQPNMFKHVKVIKQITVNPKQSQVSNNVVKNVGIQKTTCLAKALHPKRPSSTPSTPYQHVILNGQISVTASNSPDNNRPAVNTVKDLTQQPKLLSNQIVPTSSASLSTPSTEYSGSSHDTNSTSIRVKPPWQLYY